MSYNIGDYIIGEGFISRVVSIREEDNYKDSFDGRFTCTGRTIWYDLEVIKNLDIKHTGYVNNYTRTSSFLKSANYQKLISTKWAEFIYDFTT